MTASIAQYLGQDSLLNFLRAKRGLPKSVSRQVVNDLVDFIICSLCQQNRVHIPGLGSFTRTPDSRYGARLKFRPTSKVKAIIRQGMDEQHQSVLNYIEEDMDVAPPSPPPNELGKDRPNGENMIRSSFLYYLRSGFPYGKDWEHPLTGSLFSQQLIKDKLEFYKEYYPENYNLLYALWTNQQSREKLATQYKYSASTIQRRWNDAINCVLALILFPELEPDVPLRLYDD